MNKQEFLKKWGSGNKIFIHNLESLIANEIAKAKEVKLEEAKPQLELNPIEQAYHNYEPIRYKKWEKFQWIKKHSEFEAKTENGAIFNVVSLSFNTHPQLWELYTEPTEQPAKPFDRQRFEAIYLAVVAGGQHIDDFMATENTIKLLDAYYADKEKGGNNG